MTETAPIARRSAAVWVGLYLAVGLLTAVTQRDVGQAAWYPAIGIGVALCLVHGLRCGPIVLIAELIISTTQYGHLTGGVVSAVVTTAEVLGTAALLRRVGFRSDFDRVDDVLLMGLIATITTSLGAAVGSLALHLADVNVWRYATSWSIWMVGDLSGIVLVLPMVLLYHHRHRTSVATAEKHRAEAWLIGALAILLVAGYFSLARPHELGVVNAGPFMICLLPIFWIAIRFGLTRTATLIAALDTVAVVAYAGVGPRVTARAQDTPDTRDLIALQLPVLVVAIAAIGVAAAIGATQRSRSREKTLVDASPAAIIAVDARGRVQSWNPAAERIFGYAESEVMGRELPVVGEHDREEFRSWLASPTINDLAPARLMVHKDGHTVVGRTVLSPLTLASGEIGSVGVIEDVTAELASLERQALLNTAFDQAGEAIIITTPEPAIIYANPAALTSSGYRLEEVLGENPRLFKSGEQGRQLYEQMWATLLAGERWEGVLVNRRKTGELYEERSTIGPVFDPQGKLVAYVAVKHDLSRERLLEADLRLNVEIRSTALRAMKGIERQATPHETAQAMCESIAQVTGVEVCIAELLDDGSAIILGHHGAAVSQLAALPLPAGTVQRYAAFAAGGAWSPSPTGEHFVDSAWRTSLLDAGMTGVMFSTIRTEGKGVGFMLLATSATNGAEWMRQHLALADELGAFTSVLLGSQIEDARQHVRQRDELQDIIDQRSFHTVFQPWVSLDTGVVGGYEALTRFDNGTPPDVMIDSAWEVGLGTDLEVACGMEAIATANRVLPGMPISLNFSPETIQSGGAATVVAIAQCPIVVEVTEHTPIQDYPALRAALELCGKIKVSVDDAGAGFASMRHILELHPHVVKLDIGLIRGIDTDLGRQALAAGLCHYAEQTDTVLIAEGIETEAEAAAVRMLGVHNAQGYFFGRPAKLPTA